MWSHPRNTESKQTLGEEDHDFSYLNNTTFTGYRDLHEPIIGLSKDGTIAWAILQVKVEGNRKTDEGTERNLDFTCAYFTLYERQGDKWMRLTDVSTFK